VKERFAILLFVSVFSSAGALAQMDDPLLIATTDAWRKCVLDRAGMEIRSHKATSDIAPAVSFACRRQKGSASAAIFRAVPTQGAEVMMSLLSEIDNLVDRLVVEGRSK
jgi:hypothetical protein